ncbi:MAG: ABC transporter ATP-binding protein [Clostridiales bacterium]|nr:ABC transporter ATP-binding protein [Clostridiales bacterium]
MGHLSLVNVSKSFGKTPVLKGLSMDIRSGEFVTLLGESGCGKTTTLRCVAGLETADSGDILLNGESIKDLPPDKRNVNTVFQNYALFPHMNVYDNIAYGPKLRRASKNEIKRGVAEMLDLVKMPGLEKRMPGQLSGGQRQRVAIARALINKPQILLLDEPLGALDMKLRQHMQLELKHIQAQAGVTCVYVTHDQDEALNMSTRIAVMNGGAFEQVGTPQEVYEQPRTAFVAGFVGERNIHPVSVEGHNGDVTNVILDGIRIKARGSALLKAGDSARLAVHTDRAVILPQAPGPGGHLYDNILPCVVQSVNYSGHRTKISVLLNGGITFIIAEYNQSGSNTTVSDGMNAYVAFDANEGVLVSAV